MLVRGDALSFVALAAAAALIASAAPARGQDASSGSSEALVETPGATQPSAPLPSMSIDSEGASGSSSCARGDEYASAVNSFVHGDETESLRLLEVVLQDCQNHERAQVLRTRILRWRASRRALTAAATTPPTAPSLSGPERPHDLARAELSATLGTIGLANAAWVCTFARCDGVAAIATTVLIPTVLSVASGLATWGGIRPGQALVVNYGALWGSYWAPILAVGVEPSCWWPGCAVRGIAMPLGTAIGIGVGSLVAAFAPPTAGHVALMNSLTLWTGFGAMMLHVGVASFGGSSPQALTAQTVAVTMSAGILGGIVGNFFRVSRIRMFFVDMIVGLAALTGVPIGVGAYPTFHGTTVGLFASGISTLIALPLALASTVGIDRGRAPDSDRPPNVSFAPIGPWGTPGLSLIGSM